MLLSLEKTSPISCFSDNVAERKRELRKIFTEKRKIFSANDKRALAENLCKNLCSLTAFNEADTVLSFWPLENETDVREINKKILELGKTLALPKCVKGTREMIFYSVKSFDELEKGSFSIMEPKDSCPIFIPESERKILCIVPALAYDTLGFRLGYGGGFYDRYLSKYNLVAVGVVYHQFLTDNLPKDMYDISVNAVVTDKKIINISKL